MGKRGGWKVDRGIPITEIYYLPTGRYGYRVYFAGRSPHHGLETFDTVQAVLDACDGHREKVWEETSDADESGVLFRSKSYVPGSVEDRMSRWKPGR